MQHAKTFKNIHKHLVHKLLETNQIEKGFGVFLSSVHMRRQRRHSKLSSSRQSSCPQNLRNSPKTSFQKTLFFNKCDFNQQRYLSKVHAVCKLPETSKTTHCSSSIDDTWSKQIYLPQAAHSTWIEGWIEFTPSQTLPARWLGTNGRISIPTLAKTSVNVHANR